MNARTLGPRMLALCCATALYGCGDATPAAAEQEQLGTQQQAEQVYSPGTGWNLVWSDEFDGTALNTANWTTLNSNWDPVTNNCNFGTGELEYPRTQNVTVGSGKLVISAQRTTDNPMDSHCTGYGGRSFYSGRLHTKGKVEKQYGKIVASIKVPSGYGMWPAFWTLGANISSVGWPACGEIDIQEWSSNSPTWMKSATHWYNGGQADWGTGADRGYSLADAFHIYEVEWNSSSMVFRLDGTIVAQNTFYHNETEFQQPHYVILDLALGGNFYGNPSPSSVDLPAGTTKTMEVEWVRWYQQGSSTNMAVTNPSFESGLTGWSTWTPNGTAAAAYTETYNGAHSGSYHLTHWTNGTPFETWTYQVATGLPSGNYKVRGWVRKGGSFNISRIQAKTCSSCAPAYTDLGTYGAWTQVETPVISVTGGYLEFGFHTQATTGSSANFVHMDDVELIKL